MMLGQVLDVVNVDHCYSKPWSAHPDASNARPLKTLFMGKYPRNKSLEQSMPEPDIPLDVVTTLSKLPTTYDIGKARSIMHETEKQLSSLREERGEEWEERINRTGWTPQQNRLFNKTNKILNSDRLARLTFESNLNEAVLRRIQVDKTATRFRQALASSRWDLKLTQWLHGVLVDNLSTPLLAAYIDTLQTLRAKIPNLIDRMTAGGGFSSRSQAVSGDFLYNLLKKPWDPVLNTYSQNKLKLPGNPLILVAPSGPTNANSLQSKRMKYWTNQLLSIGKVIPVTMHTVNNGSGVSIAQCLEHMIVAVKTKVAELKTHYLNRPVVLLGWNIGALVACHVALQEIVSAVVCLGFPYTGVGGGRGDADDPLLDGRTPTLFVIGQHANTSTIDDIEDLREKMRADNSLLVVGGADDNLRMSRAKRRRECLTQVMVDKLILDEVADFLGGILSLGPIMQESVVVDLSDLDLRKHRKTQLETRDELDGDVYSTQTRSPQPKLSQQGRMTIAKALRARALASSSSLDSPQSLGSITSSSSISVPVKAVKRKYTKRKGVSKTVGSCPSPRKRFRSTPTPPLMSPVTSSLQSPLSAGVMPNVAGAPELSGLLKTQAGLLPAFRILTEDGQHKVSLFSSPQTTSVGQMMCSAAVNLPSPSILGTLDEPLIAMKLEDYNKRFEPDLPAAKPTITIEGLLRSQREAASTPVTSTPISSLLSLARHIPAVHITTASTVSNQIQQLLSSLARSTNNTSSPSASVPSTVLTPLKLPSSQSGVSQTAGLSHIQINQPSGHSHAQMSQSGSPLQNSVPTLMSSLAKTSSLTGGNVIKIITPTNMPLQNNVKLEEKALAVQKLQFPEVMVPGNVSNMAGNINQNVESLKSASGRIQVIESESVRKPSPVETQAQIHITVNRSGAYAAQTSAGGIVSGVPGSLVSNVSMSPLTSIPKPMISMTSLSDSLYENASCIVPPLTSIPKPVLMDTASSLPSLSQGGHTYNVSPVDTLGQVSSMLGSSPITEYATHSYQSSIAPNTISTASISNPRINVHPTGGVASVTGSQKVATSRAPPNVTVSYTATPKQSLSTLAATRTRRIRIPKQFDL